jgi:hypothetical protein
MFGVFTLLLLVLSLGALACDLTAATASKPIVVINSPPNGNQFREGEDIAVQSTSTDSSGIIRVELVVDGAIIRTDPASSPQTSFSVIQIWNATHGTHSISVRAYNSAGGASDPATISISVLQATALGPAHTPTSVHISPTVSAPAHNTATPTSTAVHIAPTVTPPAHITLTPTTSSLPPSGPTNTPPAPLPPPSAGCSGTPNIASFTAAATTISAGNSTTLQWGAVTNADSAEISPGIGGVATPGSRTVSLGATTTYTLTTRCGANTTTRQVTITVLPVLGFVTPAGPPPPNIAGLWYHNFGTINLSQSGTNITGTNVNDYLDRWETIAGTVSSNGVVNGTWSWGGASGTFVWALQPGDTFGGNWNGTNKWCGARSGVAFPVGCSFAGSWTTRIPNNLNCSMNLTRMDASVSGTYCNGSLSGRIRSGSNNETILEGTWSIPGGSSGPLRFYLLGYAALQFQGNYNTSYGWCGYRSGAAPPSPCLR